MKKRISISMAVALMVIAAALTFVISSLAFVMVSNKQLEQYSSLSQKFDKLFDFDSIVNGRFVSDISDDEVMDGILKGYISGLGDPYSNYLDAENYQDLMDSLNSSASGLGLRVLYDEETGYINVYNVMKGSPAQTAGVAIGDLIVSVEGQDVLELGYYGSLAALQGELGTIANFTVARGLNYAEEHNISVARSAYETSTVTYHVVGENIGYIRFEDFALNTPQEFKDALAVLTEMEVERLIFDVRNNRGGELDSIISILDTILPEGVIMTTTPKEGDGRTYTSDSNFIDMPMAVLINDQTYSAAELFAAALRDFDVATLVGVTTHGKGVMQSIIPLGDGTAVSLTTEYFNPPSGVNFNEVGVAPDVASELADELAKRFYSLTEYEDTQLQAAIQALYEAA